jgi:hypothetical protein
MAFRVAEFTLCGRKEQILLPPRRDQDDKRRAPRDDTGCGLLIGCVCPYR